MNVLRTVYVNLATAPHHFEERLRLAEELDVARRAGVTIDAGLWSLVIITHTFLEAGQRGCGEEAWTEFRSLAERIGVPNGLSCTTCSPSRISSGPSFSATAGIRLADWQTDSGLMASVAQHSRAKSPKGSE